MTNEAVLNNKLKKLSAKRGIIMEKIVKVIERGEVIALFPVETFIDVYGEEVCAKHFRCDGDNCYLNLERREKVPDWINSNLQEFIVNPEVDLVDDYINLLTEEERESVAQKLKKYLPDYELEELHQKYPNTF